MVNDILKFQHRVDQRANALAQEMLKTLNASRETVIGKLASLQDRFIKGDFNEETFKRKKAFLAHQRAEVEKVIEEVYAEIKSHVSSSGQDVISATVSHTIKTMNKATGLDFSFFHLDEPLVQSWFETSTVEGLVINDWLSKLESNTVDRIPNGKARWPGWSVS